VLTVSLLGKYPISFIRPSTCPKRKRTGVNSKESNQTTDFDKPSLLIPLCLFTLARNKPIAQHLFELLKQEEWHCDSGACTDWLIKALKEGS